MPDGNLKLGDQLLDALGVDGLGKIRQLRLPNNRRNHLLDGRRNHRTRAADGRQHDAQRQQEEKF